jgi:2-polyprenyl-6-methoxyphenol hydroxylase-like FAD-dependent oxidoreductase
MFLYFVSDSAHVVHPLAGQGLNMGLGDVEAMIRALKDAFYTGQDLTDDRILAGYESSRYAKNALALAGCDALHGIGISSGPFGHLARSAASRLYRTFPRLGDVTVDLVNNHQ